MAEDQRLVLIRMLERLLEDLKNVQQKGTGYYTCEPFVSRYNKILGAAKEMFEERAPLLKTFGPIEGTESVDPLDKMKVTQKVMVEGNQLAVLMQSPGGEASTL